MNKKQTVKDAKLALAAMGYTLRKRDGEYSVKRFGAAIGEGYFTDDLQDAFDTGKRMAADALARKYEQERTEAIAKGPLATLRFHVSGAIARGEGQAIVEQRETFAQYLARVGRDQAESGRECTAQDYAMASKRIEELEQALADSNVFLFACMNGNTPNGRSLITAHQIAADTLADTFQHLNA